MNKLIPILTMLALTLPVSAIAQAEDDGPHPDRDRADQRERGERPDRPDDRDGDRDHDRHDHRDRGDHRFRREPISAEQVDEAIATIRAMHGEHKVGWLDRIEALAKDDPAEAAKHLSRYPRLREMMDARKNRPDEFELHSQQSRLMRQVFSLMREVHKAKTEEDEKAIASLRGQLRERFEGLFEVRLKLKAIEIRNIRASLESAEHELAQIKADRDKLIDEKLDELMNKDFRRWGRRDDDRGDRDRPERDERRPKPDRHDRDE